MTIEINSRSSVYFDSNVIIYFAEYDSLFWDRIEAIFRQINIAGARAMTSEVTLAECLLKPSRDGNDALVHHYKALLQSGFIDLIPLTGDLAIRSAEEGGALGLSLIDAIHYVSALEAACDVFVTADQTFKSSPYLEVVGI